MFVWILKILAYFWLVVTVLNASIKLFGSLEMVHLYAGSDRHLDTDLLVIAFCIIFLALAFIIEKLDAIMSELNLKEH